MRIAILDDNIADRRHAERLLKRESDRIHSQGCPSYVIDCYGNTEKLFPMADTYDIFLIDMTEDPAQDGLEIARMLRGQDIPQPVILGISGIDYRGRITDEDRNFFFISKPYVTESLIGMLHDCEKHIVKREGMIELRTDSGTLHVSHQDILYGVETGSGHLTVGTRSFPPVRIISDASSFYRQLQGIKKAPAIIPVSSRAFINVLAISGRGIFSVTMEDGRRIRVSSGFRQNIIDALQAVKNA